MVLNAHEIELIKELKRSQWLPPYNDDLILQSINQINGLADQIAKKIELFGDDVGTHPHIRIGVMINHQRLLRTKRCLLAYINYRTEKIRDLRWEIGNVIPDSLETKLCREEIDFFSSYDQILTDYMNTFNMDLTTDLKPPKELYIEVRVIIKGQIEVLIGNGFILLKENSIHFLRRSDAEDLIKKGIVIHIKN